MKNLTPTNLFVKRNENTEINDGIKLELFRNTYETLYKDVFMNAAKNTNIFDRYSKDSEVFIDAPKSILSANSTISASGLDDGIFLLHVAALLTGEELSLYGGANNSTNEKIATIQIHPSTGYKVDVFNNYTINVDSNPNLNRAKNYKASIKKMLDKYGPTSNLKGDFYVNGNPKAARDIGIVSAISQIVSNSKYDINEDISITVNSDNSISQVCIIKKISDMHFYLKLPSGYFTDKNTYNDYAEYSINDLHKLAYSSISELVNECLSLIKSMASLGITNALSENDCSDICILTENIQELLKLR